MNVQIVGPPGAGKTTLVRELVRHGLNDRTGYRPACDARVAINLVRDVIVSRRKTDPLSAALKIVDHDSKQNRRECMTYMRTCSEVIFSQNEYLDDAHSLWKRLMHQVAIWGRFSESTNIGLYDDHFYQNFLSFCALRKPTANFKTLLHNTPHPDFAIFVQREPEECFKNMRNRRRGPPRILLEKEPDAVVSLLKVCNDVADLLKGEAHKFGVSVISVTDEVGIEQLVKLLRDEYNRRLCAKSESL